MSTCKRCGGPMQELFLSMACKQECDLKPVSKLLRGRAALEALLANKCLRLDDGFKVWNGPDKWWVIDPRGGVDTARRATEREIRLWFSAFETDNWEVCDAPTM